MPTIDPSTLPDALQRALSEAAAQAEALRATARPEVAHHDALAEVGAAGHLVDRLLADLFEALKSVCVAGLAYPDPELSDELASLAERARALSMATAHERLLCLRAWILAITDEKRIDARNRLARGAWNESQKLLAWHRMMRTEHDLLTVQGRMAQRVVGAGGARSEAADVASLTAYPVGIDLDDAGKLLLLCVDLEGGEPVILRDHLSEFDREDPLHRRAISRLFQDAVELKRVLSGVLRLEDHPVVRRPDARLFRPAFRAIPKRLAVASDYQPPALPPLDLKPGAPARSPAQPMRLDATITRTASGFRVRDAEAITAPLALTATLRANLTKLVARQGDRTVSATLSVLLRDGELRVLDMHDALGDRCFPAQDPTLFTLPVSQLAQWADRVNTALATSPAVGAYVRAAVMLQGGASEDDVKALRAALPTLPRAGLDDHFRAAQAMFLLGDAPTAEATLDLVRDVLTVVNNLPATNLPAMARVLGRPEADVSPADARLLDGAVVHKALWLALASGAASSLTPELETLWAARYDKELKAPSPGDVAARALLMTFRAGELAGYDDALDEDAKRETQAEATGFLDAHLDSMVDGRRKTGASGRKGAPMPELDELFALADAYAWVCGADRRSATVTLIRASRERVLQPVLDALCDALLQSPIGRSESLRAADALVVARVADLHAYVVTR